MQAGTAAMTGSAVNITAPCCAEAFRIYSLAHTFTLQWVIRLSELAANQNQAAVGQAAGAAISAEESSATDFFIETHAPYGNPFNIGEVIAIAVGTNADTLYIRPIRVGRA